MTGTVGAMRVRREPTSAAAVRRELGADLTDRGVARERIDEILVVASELVGNAIRHSGAARTEWIDVTWEIDAAGITIHVGDSSMEDPQPRAAKPDETSGRGLAIVRAISDDWGVQRLGNGKRVWAHVPLYGVSV